MLQNGTFQKFQTEKLCLIDKCDFYGACFAGENTFSMTVGGRQELISASNFLASFLSFVMKGGPSSWTKQLCT